LFLVGEFSGLYMMQFYQGNIHNSAVTNQNAKRSEILYFPMKSLQSGVFKVFPLAAVYIPPYAEFGRNDHREDAPHFTMKF